MKTSLLLLIIFALCVPFLTACGGKTTSPQTQVCLGDFVQDGSVTIGQGSASPQQLPIVNDCLRQNQLKRAPATTVASGKAGDALTITIQPYSNMFIGQIQVADPVVVNNCGGTTNLTQVISVRKAVTGGVLLGATFYTEPPAANSANTLDRLAAALFVHYPSQGRAVTEATFDPTVSATPNTQTTVYIYWTETLIGGHIQASQSQDVVINSVFAIPVGLHYGRMVVLQPSSCQ